MNNTDVRERNNKFEFFGECVILVLEVIGAILSGLSS
jgi:hypothetical protein